MNRLLKEPFFAIDLNVLIARELVNKAPVNWVLATFSIFAWSNSCIEIAYSELVHEPEAENWAWEYQRGGKLYHMFLKTTRYKLYIFGW